jgi:hypothetical protein
LIHGYQQVRATSANALIFFDRVRKLKMIIISVRVSFLPFFFVPINYPIEFLNRLPGKVFIILEVLNPVWRA